MVCLFRHAWKKTFFFFRDPSLICNNFTNDNYNMFSVEKVVEQKFSNRSSWKWKRANIWQVKQKNPTMVVFVHNSQWQDKGIIIVIIAIFSSRMFGLLSQAVEQDKMKEIAVGYNHTLSFQSSFLNTASSHAISVLIIVITAEHILHCLNLSIWAWKCLCCVSLAWVEL